MKWSPYCYSWGYIATMVPTRCHNTVHPAFPDEAGAWGYASEGESDAFSIATYQLWETWGGWTRSPYTVENLGPWITDPPYYNIPEEWSSQSTKEARLWDGRGYSLIGGGKFKYRVPTCEPGWTLRSVPNNDGTGTFTRYYCSKPKVASDACGVGNPVEVSAGEKFAVDTIISLGDLSLSLTYSSHPISFYAAGSVDGGFGRGRTHNFERRVQDTSGAQMWVYRSARDVRYFNQSGSVWLPRDADTSDRLTEKLASGVRVGWTYYDASENAFEEYDAAGRLVSINRRDGMVLTLTYDAQGRLLTVTNPFGRSLTFDYAGSDLRVQGVTDSGAQRTQFSYDAKGRLLGITFPGGAQRSYLYNEPAHTGGVNLPDVLTGIIDELGFRYATYTYDATGRVTSSAHHADATTRVNEFKFSVPASYEYARTLVTDPLGNTRQYDFTQTAGAYRPTALSQPCTGQAAGASFKTRTYDANGNVASRTDFNDKKVCYGYDLARNLETARVEGALSGEACATVLQTLPSRADVRKVSTQWHATWRLPVKVAEPKRITSYVYNGDGVGGAPFYCAPPGAQVNGSPIGVLCRKTIQATTDATGQQGLAATATGTPRTWSYTYNAWGQVLTAADPNSNPTSTTYYAADDPALGKRGNVNTITNAAGHVTTVTAYDATGRPLSMTDPNGVVTSLTYHPRGWLTSRTVGGETTVYDYDALGQLTKVTLPDGSYLQYLYDGAHWLTQIRDGLGNTLVYTLDAMGNRIKEEAFDPGLQLTRRRQQVFDSLNRLHQRIGGQ